MAHGTRISGAAYGISGGKCLVGGTEYGIKKGRTLTGGTGYDISFFDGYKIVVTNSDGSQLRDSAFLSLRINGTSIYGSDGEIITIVDMYTVAITTGTFYGTGICQLGVFLTRGKLYINGVETALNQMQYMYTITTNVTIDITYSTSVGVIVRITEQ